MTKQEEYGTILSLWVGTIGLWLALLLLRAFTAFLFWRWYVVPTFHAPTLSLWAACGCLLFLNLAVGPGPFTSEKTPPWGVVVMQSLGWLGIAWALAGILNLLK